MRTTEPAPSVTRRSLISDGTLSLKQHSIVVAASVHLDHHAHVRIGIPAQAPDPGARGAWFLDRGPCDPHLRVALHVLLLRHLSAAGFRFLALRLADRGPS